MGCQTVTEIHIYSDNYDITVLRKLGLIRLYTGIIIRSSDQFWFVNSFFISQSQKIEHIVLEWWEMKTRQVDSDRKTSKMTG